MRTSLATVLAAAIAALLIGLTAGSAHAAISSGRYEKQVLTRTNQVRDAHDRVVLKRSACLDRYAGAWAKKLATQTQALQHRSLSSLRTIMRRCSLDRIAENLAWGYPTGGAVVNAWQKSSGHRHNQLGKGYRTMGIGMYRDNAGRAWTAALYGNPR